MEFKITNANLNKKIRDTLRLFGIANYRYRTYLWEVGYSGGKDSTVVVHLLLDFILRSLKKGKKLPKKIFILYSDTLLDIPILRETALSTLEAINEFARKNNIDHIIEARALKPKVGEDFFSCMIDRGYPVPHHRFRWCIPRLKIRPVQIFLAEALSSDEYDGLLNISGIRLNESSERNRLLNKRFDKKKKKLSPFLQDGDIVMFAPIFRWTTNDVWSFLYNNNPLWGGSYNNLIDAYRIADTLDFACTKECKLAPTARFGCWVCTVIKKDKTLENIFKNTNNDGIRFLNDMKENIRDISGEPKYRERVNGRFRSLNTLGRLKIIEIIAKVVIKAPEGLKGYLEDQRFRSLLVKWFEKYLKMADSSWTEYEDVVDALERIKTGQV